MSATVHLDILKQIRIASPCDMAWEEMQGDDRKRRCDQCNLEVHNLSSMTRAEIEALVMNADGRICGRIRRRADDTIITADCPVGLAALRDKAGRGLARAIALASFFLTAGVLFAQDNSDDRPRGKLEQLQPFKWALQQLTPAPPASMPGAMVLTGKVAAPSPAPSRAPSPPDPSGQS